MGADRRVSCCCGGREPAADRDGQRVLLDDHVRVATSKRCVAPASGQLASSSGASEHPSRAAGGETVASTTRKYSEFRADGRRPRRRRSGLRGLPRVQHAGRGGTAAYELGETPSSPRRSRRSGGVVSIRDRSGTRAPARACVPASRRGEAKCRASELTERSPTSQTIARSVRGSFLPRRARCRRGADSRRRVTLPWSSTSLATLYGSDALIAAAAGREG